VLNHVVKLLLQVEPQAIELLLACLVITGGLLSVTLNTAEVVDLLPQSSEAVKTTVTEPQLGADTLQL
jgi:hypothetical protein